MRKLCYVCVLLCGLFTQKAYSTHTATLDIHTIQYGLWSAPDTIIPPVIELMENEARLICPTLPGVGSPVLTNLACEQLAFGGAVFNAGESCFTYTSGLNEGTDIICVEACDNLGLVCDTFIYTILVDPAPIPPPSAGNDVVSAAQNDTLNIDVLANDTVVGSPIIIIISVDVENGTVSVNANNTISYIPDEGFCGADSLTYVVCAGDVTNCSSPTAVSIDVVCSEAPFTVYNGFSPNNDGINDVLVIDNLDRVPEHKVNIFNRWGNLVFAAKTYQSDWDGKWNGEDLPDGTYFYVIDDGNGNSYHGYIQLQR